MFLPTRTRQQKKKSKERKNKVYEPLPSRGIDGENENGEIRKKKKIIIIN